MKARVSTLPHAVPIDSCASSSALLAVLQCVLQWALGNRSPRFPTRGAAAPDVAPRVCAPSSGEMERRQALGPPYALVRSLIHAGHGTTEILRSTTPRQYNSSAICAIRTANRGTAAAERCFWPRAWWALGGRRQTRCRAARRPRAAAVCAGTVIVARGPASCHCALTAPLRPPLTRLDGDRQAKEGGQEGGEEG